MKYLTLCLCAGLMPGGISVAHAMDGVLAEAHPLQHTLMARPWVGKIIDVTYPIGRFRLEFDLDARTMRWHSLEDPELKDTVQYTARVVKPGIYSINWYEPSYDEHAFQFQDWRTGTVHTVLIPSQPEIQSATGTFRVVGRLP